MKVRIRTRPWGGFFVIDENQAQQFSNTFFDGISVQELKISGKLSPKILIVEPGKRFLGNIIIDVRRFGRWFKGRLG